ncbi:MAG: carbohydrate kinase family protein [Deltaproteobacteria bacterium]
METIHILGSGALNLDLIYEVEDLACLRDEGFPLYPGREIASDKDMAARLLKTLDRRGSLIVRCGGGSAANTVCALQALGWRTAFTGILGNDPEGDAIAASMPGVDLSRVKRAGKSALCIVVLERKTRDRSLCVIPSEPHGGLSLLLETAARRIEAIPIVHMSSLVEENGIAFHEGLAQAMHPSQILSLDPGEIYAGRGLAALSAVLGRVDVLFLTETEIRLLTGLSPAEGAQALLALLHSPESTPFPFFSSIEGPAVVRKQGAQGATLHTRRGEVSVPARPVKEIVDNTGAGDAFNAGFIHGILKGEDPEGCLEAGIGTAARSLTAPGRGWIDKLTRGHTE